MTYVLPPGFSIAAEMQRDRHEIGEAHVDMHMHEDRAVVQSCHNEQMTYVLPAGFSIAAEQQCDTQDEPSQQTEGSAHKAPSLALVPRQEV